MFILIVVYQYYLHLLIYTFIITLNEYTPTMIYMFYIILYILYNYIYNIILYILLYIYISIYIYINIYIWFISCFTISLMVTELIWYYIYYMNLLSLSSTQILPGRRVVVRHPLLGGSATAVAHWLRGTSAVTRWIRGDVSMNGGTPMDLFNLHMDKPFYDWALKHPNMGR